MVAWPVTQVRGIFVSSVTSGVQIIDIMGEDQWVTVNLILRAVIFLSLLRTVIKQDRQCTYNLILRRVCVTIVAMEKQKYYVL